VLTDQRPNGVGATPAAPGELRNPATDEGARVLDLLAAQLPLISAGADHHDRLATFPTDTFTAFAANGLLGATVPAELGGLGMERLSDVALALCTLGEADASTALALHVQWSRGLTLAYEWRHGSASARGLAERMLRQMATGEAAVCGAVKDHHTAVTTIAPDGTGGWLVSGRKALVSMAPVATHFFVYAQRELPDGNVVLAAPMLRRDTPGLTVHDTWDGLGMRASGTVDIVLDNCPVAESDVLHRGPVGVREDAVLAGQTVSSITMLGIYTGVVQAARDLAVAALARRHSLPAGARSLLAEIDARLYAVRASVAAALANADRWSAERSGDPDERGRRMMVPFQCAKMMLNKLGPEIVNDCLVLVGGAAYSGAHPLSRLYRDVRAGSFMQPYTYVDGVEFLSGQALGVDRDNDYMSVRAAAARDSRGGR
jgi:alkylation response protein AidB-like acyl-CoA dehydrogenase